MLTLYTILTSLSTPILNLLLWHRLKKGKENAARINERRGITNIKRPNGKLVWIHAASVGESQSALILINRLLAENKHLNILVTSGTLTSATLMQKRLAERAMHQFVPLDHPKWIKRFLKHWRPNVAIWIESELWPNMLQQIKNKRIPAALVNARLSQTSFRRWFTFKHIAEKILSSFKIILTQTELDRHHFEKLKAKKVVHIGNIKHSADPLPYDETAYNSLSNAIGSRPTWVYASTHDGEEELACRVHLKLKEKHPDLLTIIVPRHPERRNEIVSKIKNLNIISRHPQNTLPEDTTDIYLADTLGELGLFYKACPIAMIGRSFSNDGGGGHNPLEAAQLNCAVLTGPNIQYQQELFSDMIGAQAATLVNNENEFIQKLNDLLSNKEQLQNEQEKALIYASQQSHIIDDIMVQLKPILKKVL
ncbi:MAG: 3-deoxy-D-manno-octulosonic acid transferase [Micavibrio sp.]|nr:3-deoxy-D-manno-octulosonic acid transferase [Micavibrio sp.]